MRSILSVGLLLACATASAAMQEAPVGGMGTANPSDPAPKESPAQSALPIRDEAPVVVSGKLPGPGMWKVSRNGHVMYVLGTISHVPKGMEWISLDVEKALAQAGEVLYPPGYKIDFDVGFFGRLALIPTAMGLPKNPDGKTLRDVVPVPSYARWLELKQRYIGRDDDVEEMRPIFAAEALEQAAFKKSGLKEARIWPVIESAIRKHDIKVTKPQFTATIKDPKVALKELRAGSIDDIACFDKTLANLETDVARMTERANAWATGDVQTLRALPLGDQGRTCMDALLKTSAAQKRGLGDAVEQTKQVWMPAAEVAIASNPVSFAVLPMSEVLKADGYLAALQAKGYDVEAPDAAAAGADDASD